MPIRHGHFSSLASLSMLLTLAVLLPGSVSAQDFVDRPNPTNRNYSAPAGFPRFITIDHPLFSDIRSAPFTRPLGNRQLRQPLVSQRPVDGTWQDDGGTIVIKLDGRELRLRNTSAAEQPAKTKTRDDSLLLVDHIVAESSSTVAVAGAAIGRLMNRSRPLINCRVSLIPLRRKGKGYTVDGRGKPQTTQTDEDGYYRFENVPLGPHKLFWLPTGQTRWIRRLEYKPDVHIHRNETSRIKTIGVALRTLN